MSLVRPLSVLSMLAAMTGVVACTSFEFKRSSRGTAPRDLQEHSRMIVVAGGRGEMGFQSGEPDEFPPHPVTVSSFLLDTTEVTLAEYARCIGARVCQPSPLTLPEVPSTHPVVGVSWFEARRYCEWVGKRLPTEAEFEHAARHPHGALYPWNGPADPKKANARGAQDGYEFTAPVGSFAAGATGTGVFDLAGNAAEWTADWYDATYYQKSPENNPTGPEATTGERVVRGGAWSDADYGLRATSRRGLDPNVANSSIGFRCAADTDPALR
jgi:formylglycine-generating enzyme required for sulfatase activity